MPSKSQIDTLRNKLTKWADAYHNTNKPLVSDEEYDDAVDQLEEWSPNDPFFDKIGAPIKGKNKVKLKYMMPSLKKVRIGKGLEKWLAKSSGKIAALDKLDGSSAAIEQNAQLQMFSRGNGTVGRDISRLLPKVKGIPTKLNRNDNIRGELMMTAADFKQWEEDFNDPRSLVNGIVNSDKSTHQSVKNVTFIAHEYVNPKLSWDKARIKLKGMGFTTASTKTFFDPTPEELNEYFSDRKKQSKYILDGLVLIDLKTGEKVSFKVDQPPVSAVVKHVEYNISQNAIYKPRIILKTPVVVGGVKVTKITGHNARYIVDHGIGPGAIIKIIRSGDVIPKVVGVIKSTKPQLPDNFVWSASKIEALAGKLSKGETQTVNAKQLVTSCVILGIEGVRIGTATKLVESGLDSIKVLLASDKKTIAASGIGNVNTDKLFDNIQKAKNNLVHSRLMEASGIWPKGYTVTRFNIILNAIPYKQLLTLYKQDTKELRADIAELSQMSSTSALQFLKGLAPYTRYVKALREDGIVVKRDTDVVRKANGVLTGKSFVFTKIRSKSAEAFITANGGEVSNRVNDKTTMLIVPNKLITSDKVSKAEDLNIKIITLADFGKKFKIEV